MEEDPSALTPGTVLAGRFRVVRCLGQGGMGSVYEIEHELTKHRRALKLLHATFAQSAGVVERFLREASAAGRVGNPHIVETFDAGTLDTKEPYLVMEILRGQTLSDRIAAGPMPLVEVVDLIGQACDGVQAAHDAGIVHRDLKPDNLFITDLDGRAFVKILDFGISKFDPSKTGGMALTQEGAALGTPYYMSPEQIRGEAGLDARADVYALGVILYECLAGVRPFEADALTQLAVLIHTGKPKPLSEHRPDLPQGFAEVVSRAMAADRTLRTGSANELRVELERYGSVAFRSRGTPSPAEFMAPARSIAEAQSLATSAAGVSVRAATAPKKGQTTPIVAGFAILALVGAAIAIAHSTGKTAPDASASAGQAPSATPTAARTATAEPAAASATAPAPLQSVAVPPPAPPPAKTPSPEVAPILPPPTQPAAASSAGRPSAAPSADHRSRRTDEKGLAKDNPFR